MPNQHYDHSSELWQASPAEHHFRSITIRHRRQEGGSCVSTGLSLLTGDATKDIRDQINTQDPVSWSEYLQAHGMKLAYCPTDFRRLKYYVDELLTYDDLFTISTYTPLQPEKIGAEPDSDGWVCGSHFVILHRDTVYDTKHDRPILLREYQGNERFVKRLFRVVPVDFDRGL